MPNSKPYKIPKDASKTVCEPATAYQRQPATAGISSSNQWNPNVPFCGTQEEWWEHFHRIEEGPFSPVSETHKRISQWLENQKM